jgi:uncharacterized protein YjiS (DUF1127 family)
MQGARRGRLSKSNYKDNLLAKPGKTHKGDYGMASLVEHDSVDVRGAWVAVFVAFGGALGASLRFLMAAQERAQQRARLAELGPRELKDMGLTRGDIERTLQRSDYWR